MEYRRLMEGAIQPRISDVDLSQVLTQQLFQYYDSLSEAGIALEVELEEHIHYATDPELWERLLQNMLSNVLKHGKEQARLTLTSDADAIRVELRNIVQQPIQHLDQLASRFYSENLSDTVFWLGSLHYSKFCRDLRRRLATGNGGRLVYFDHYTKKKGLNSSSLFVINLCV